MKNRLLADGPPPLTEEAADCAIDLIDFMAAAVRGVDEIDVTPAVREAWRSHLATYYPMLNPADRYFFATADFSLANIRSMWPQLQEAQRNMCIQGWAAVLPNLLQFIDPALHAANPMQAAFAGLPGSASMQPPAPSLPTNTNRPSQTYTMRSPSDLMSEILAGQRKAEEDALREGGAELQMKVKLQHDSVNMDMLTTISRMKYESTKNVWKS